MIETSHLSKRYANGKLALDALSLKVESGEIHCLLGPPGAGKSTTIHLLLGFIRPTAGKALIDGVDVAERPLEARRHVAYLGRPSALYGRLSARQNLEFFAGLCGRGGDRSRYYMAMRKMGLPERAFEQPVRLLSPGMRQKLGLAMAWVKEAPALLLDEPIAHLDLKEAAEVVAILAELRDAGKAILVALGDLFWAKQLADQVTILQEGRMAVTRSQKELEYDKLEELYLDYMQGGLGTGPPRG